MIDDNILDEMNLPLASSNEDLETISNNHLKPLFDVTKFEIRSENLRDKGIDFHIEIKRENAKKKITYLNFHFAIQLKATDSKEVNKDGSISLQLYTSNINYLLNNPMPAFYVLYFQSTNTFYYESINDFAKTLYEKDANWNSQASHVLRFDKKLDASGLEEMYQLTLKKGKFQRTINEKSVMQSLSISADDKILFDADLNISDDAEIRKLIEAIGLEIINEGKWKDVIFVHKKASGNVASSAKYNLVLGIANYYSGNLIEALSFFKAATNFKTELTEDLQNHLKYFETTVKYSIGLLSDDDYNKKMQALENTDNVGLYIKLEKAKRDYVKSLNNNSKDRYEKYVADVQSVINDPKANDSIRLNAKCELILFEGFKKNMDYVKSVSMINALEEGIGPNVEMRKNAAIKFMQANKAWYKNVQALKTEASDSKNYFSYYTATINEVKVTYEFEVYTNLVFIVQEIPGVPKQEKPDNKPTFDRLMDKINHTCDFFHQIGHIENLVAALSARYEILHYLKDSEKANKTISELENIIDTYDLTEQRNKLETLKNNGTTHEKFKVWMDEIFEEAAAQKKEREESLAEMTRMDEKERNIKDKSKKDNLPINLFPIGYFQFPKKEKSKVYEILNINAGAAKIFDNMFEMVIPVANIYYNPITQEGFVDGKLAEKGIESWRNIYRIRKAFYENKFYRFENIPNGF